MNEMAGKKKMFYVIEPTRILFKFVIKAGPKASVRGRHDEDDLNLILKSFFLALSC